MIDDSYKIKKLDVELKFVKTHPDAKEPIKAHSDDNCFDVFCVEETIIPPSVRNDEGVDIGNAVVPVGLTVGYITPGFGFVIKPKSGLGFKHGIYPHSGEIDTGYRGDMSIKMYNFTSKPYTFKKGDKVAQIKVEKNWETVIELVEEVVESERGSGGFGSTGN